MHSTERQQNEHFENEVRRIARHRWPEAQYSGATKHEERERDGVFETEDCVHLLEATVSRGLEKAKEDMKKISQLARTYQSKFPNKAIKGWFITKHEPTADQRDAAKGYAHLINVVSISQFQSALIDINSYLDIRENYEFGSARDPESGTSQLRLPYIPLDLLERDTERIWSVEDIEEKVSQGHKFAIFGDYGAGKSMTLRELHQELKKRYQRNLTRQFPIYINLRDHIGQTNTAEILERHSRNIGFPNPSHLVRAWRGGYAILILDGFDEISTLGIHGIWQQLREIKYQSMQAIREFIREANANSGIILAGRSHFFSGDIEIRRCLGIQGFTHLTLNEFTTEQIQRYLENCGLPPSVPSWIPSRPLLVGYLAAHGVLSAAIAGVGQHSGLDPATGWDLILDKICDREANMELGVDGPTVRQILERVATYCRATATGRGPLTEDQIKQAFTEVCGYKPDDKSSIVLLRLPGLGIERQDEATKTFIDEDFVDACRAGNVTRYLKNPYVAVPQGLTDGDWGLGINGIDLVCLRTGDSITGKAIDAVLQHTSDLGDADCLLLDIARIAMIRKSNISTEIQIRGVMVPELSLFEGMGDFSKVIFRDCYFSRIDIDANLPTARLPKFHSCFVREIDGRSSRNDLPGGVFDRDCEYEMFSEATATTNAITQLDVPLGVIVMLTILRKLYTQAGGGRLENALQRGIGQDARRLVPGVLRVLESNGLAIKYIRGGLSETIWRPDRGQKKRVMTLLSSPHSSVDLVLQQVTSL